MSRSITIYLGKGGTHLASRSLVITRMWRAGDDSAPAAAYTNAAIANTTETVTVTLEDNDLYQAVAFDVGVQGAVGASETLNFHTGSIQFPGPSNFSKGGRLSIVSMDDLSSSSSSSSSSSQSSSSWSSGSSQSVSSSSSSSE
jgi:hypothetical protein